MSCFTCRRSTYLGVWLLLFGLSGCATLAPNFEQPEVKLVAFAPVQSQGLEQRFRIGLRILNPNANALTIRGLSYHLDLNGHKVVSGVSGDIPDVPAYGDIVVNFEAGTSLVGGARFVYDLIQGSDGIIDYKLEAKLDVGTFSPAIKLIENGQVSLDP